MRNRLAWLLLPFVVAATAVACNDDGSINADESPTGDAINREVLLSNVDDVRALLEDNASSMDPMVVNDVDFSDGNLRVVLADSQNSLDVSGLESICEQVSNAIALPDVSITVEKADASASADCEFSA